MATPAALAPAAALGIRSSGLRAGGDLGFCGRDGGRSGGRRAGRKEGREPARASTEDEERRLRDRQEGKGGRWVRS